MSLTPAPVSTPQIPMPTRHRVRPYETADAEFRPKPTPAHKIVAKNGKDVVGSGEPDTADTEPAHGKPFSFWDLVDIVNPLQHIPVVNTLYRQITGDEINNFARIAGGGLYGGFIGAALGGVNAVLADNTGKDIGETVLAMITGDDSQPEQPTASVTATTDATPAPSQTHNSQALFDGAPQSHGAAAKKSIPVIEVYPSDKQAAASLPTSKTLTALDQTAPQPVAKANVQKAMMDALLKMQADQAKAIGGTADTDS